MPCSAMPPYMGHHQLQTWSHPRVTQPSRLVKPTEMKTVRPTEMKREVRHLGPRPRKDTFTAA